MLRVSSGFEAWVNQEIFKIWHWLALGKPLRHQPPTPSRKRGPQFRTNLWLRAELPSKTGQEGSFALKSVTAPRPANGMDAKLHRVAWLIRGRHEGA